MSKHTKGPWAVEHSINGRSYITVPTGGCVAIVNNYENSRHANADLIVAAPETAAERDRLKASNAELLEFALLVSNGMVDAETLRQEARAALSRATETKG